MNRNPLAIILQMLKKGYRKKCVQLKKIQLKIWNVIMIVFNHLVINQISTLNNPYADDVPSNKWKDIYLYQYLLASLNSSISICLCQLNPIIYNDILCYL